MYKEKMNAWIDLTKETIESAYDVTIEEQLKLREEWLFNAWFPNLKNHYDRRKGGLISALEYVRDWCYGELDGYVTDVPWEDLEIETREEMIVWLKTKSWDIAH